MPCMRLDLLIGDGEALIGAKKNMGTGSRSILIYDGRGHLQASIVSLSSSICILLRVVGHDMGDQMLESRDDAFRCHGCCIAAH